MQDEAVSGGDSSSKTRHQLSPRMTFKALNEIKGSQSGLYDKYGSEENFRKTFIPEIGLPQYEDVYGQMKQSWNILRDLTFIDSQ